MKNENMTYIIIAIILIIAVFLYAKSRNSQTPKVAEKTEKERKEFYGDMRNMALTATTEQLGINEIENDKVYGLITEMDMNNGTATVVAFLTGDASIYLSSGGGFIGGGAHQDVNEKIKIIIQNIQKFKKDAIKVDHVELPKSNEVKFNFLTKNGIYQINAMNDEIMSGKSEHTDLYKEVDKIMTLIRIKSGQ